MLKTDTKIVTKRELNYILDSNGRPRRFTPWLGDSLSFMYDSIMQRSIFPKKFGGDIARHHEILREQMADIRGKRVVELATGSGSAFYFLNNDNHYVGTDISSGLLRRAARKFRAAGFSEASFYVASADDLPFDDGVFDVAICMLSLNFFPDIVKAVREIHRILGSDSAMLSTVPVPERNRLHSTIRGTLYSEEELRGIFQEGGFKFESLPAENGALLYFRAHKI